MPGRSDSPWVRDRPAVAVAQRQRTEPLRWLRESLERPTPAPVRVRRERRVRQTEPEVVAAVLAVLNDGATAFLYLRRLLGIDAALLARALGVLTLRGLVEQAGMPGRWRLVAQSVPESQAGRSTCHAADPCFAYPARLRAGM